MISYPEVSDGDPINLGQSCGGQIDPISLNATGYYNMEGEVTGTPKGFICPLGQRCQVRSIFLFFLAAHLWMK